MQAGRVWRDSKQALIVCACFDFHYFYLLIICNSLRSTWGNRENCAIFFSLILVKRFFVCYNNSDIFLWKGTYYGTTNAQYFARIPERRRSICVNDEVYSFVLYCDADNLCLLHRQRGFRVVQPYFGNLSRNTCADSLQRHVRRHTAHKALLYLDVRAALILRDSYMLYRSRSISLRRRIGHDNRHAPSVLSLLLAHA